jgi:nucleoid-associated protein YgaU
LCYALTEQHYVYDYYTVQKGDTLWGIARKVAGDENAIEPVLYAIGRDNGIDSHIYPGEVIMIRKAVD